MYFVCIFTCLSLFVCFFVVTICLFTVQINDTVYIKYSVLLICISHQQAVFLFDRVVPISWTQPNWGWPAEGEYRHTQQQTHRGNKESWSVHRYTQEYVSRVTLLQVLNKCICVCVCVSVPQTLKPLGLLVFYLSLTHTHTHTYSLILFFSVRPQAEEQECAGNVICGFSWDLI